MLFHCGCRTGGLEHAMCDYFLEKQLNCRQSILDPVSSTKARYADSPEEARNLSCPELPI